MANVSSGNGKPRGAQKGQKVANSAMINTAASIRWCNGRFKRQDGHDYVSAASAIHVYGPAERRRNKGDGLMHPCLAYFVLYCGRRSCLRRRWRWRRVGTGATPDSTRPEILTNMTKVRCVIAGPMGWGIWAKWQDRCYVFSWSGPSQSGKSRSVETEVWKNRNWPWWKRPWKLV